MIGIYGNQPHCEVRAQLLLHLIPILQNQKIKGFKKKKLIS